MRSIGMIFRTELRRRWPAWLALALLVTVIGGTVLDGVATAQRTSSAFPDFDARYGYDAGVISTNPFAKHVEDAAGVKDFAHLDYYANGNVTANGHFIPDGDISVTSLPSPRLSSTIKLLSGRWPTGPREVLIGYSMAEKLGLGVGSTIPVPFAPASQLPVVLRGGTARIDGPRVVFRVVGVGATIADFPTTEPSYSVYTSPAFDREIGPKTLSISATFVRLRHGQDGMLTFQSAINHLTTPGLLYTIDLDASVGAIEGSIHPQAIGWWLFALFAAIAGLALVGQALSRQAMVERDAYPTLAALGMRPGQLFVLGMARAGAIGVVGAVGAIILSFALSPLTPVGEARAAELSTGFVLRLPVALLGALAILGAVLLLAAVPAWRASQVATVDSGRELDVRGHSRIAAALGAAGAPPSVLIGANNALERGRGRTSTPVLTALVGTVLAVAAVIATTMFGASFTHLVTTPSLYGENWQVDLGNMPEAQVHAAAAALDREPTVTRVSYGVTGKYVRVGRVAVEAILVDVAKGPMVFSLASGHYPRGDRQILLGATTAREARAGVGSRVEVSIADAKGTTFTGRFTVAGIIAIPPSFSIGGLGDGAVLTIPTAEGLACQDAHPKQPCVHKILEQLAKTNWGMAIGTAPTAAGRATAVRLEHRYAAFLTEQAPPTSLVNFGQAVDFPLLLGVTLALFGAATLAHLLVVSVARRRRQFALLKVLGFTHRQVGTTLFSQATTIALVGVVLGVPLGIAAGQYVWRAYASNLGAVPRVVVPGGTVALLVAIIVVGAWVLAAIPATVAARVRPAEALREA